MIKTYSELVSFPTFLERYEYLKLNSRIGDETFGYDRYLNQMFYKSKEWLEVRRDVILRDCGCDLGIKDREILGKVLIHHLNPISLKDIDDRNPMILDMENLICVSHTTHNAIHYGNEQLVKHDLVIRKPNDTCPWR